MNAPMNELPRPDNGILDGQAVADYTEPAWITQPLSPADIAVFYLSMAVELFAMEHEHLADWEDDEELSGRDTEEEA